MARVSCIDVHPHSIPEDYRRAMAVAGRSDIETFLMVPWSLDQHLANMSAHGIDTSILSISDPGLRLQSLLLATVSARFPNIRFIFSHGRDTLPFLAARHAPFVAGKLALGDVIAGIPAILRQLDSFFYDLTAVTGPGALALRQFVPP